LATGTGLAVTLGVTLPMLLQDKNYVDCPKVAYDDTGNELTPNRTEADRVVSNLGAAMLGALDRTCRDGNATAVAEGDMVTYNARRITGFIITKTVAEVSLTAKKDADGILRANGVHAFALKQESLSGTTTSIQAEDVGTGWLMTVESPVEPTFDEEYSFTGNTGGSVGRSQADEVVSAGKEILREAVAN
jgi:hypothetical protein